MKKKIEWVKLCPGIKKLLLTMRLLLFILIAGVFTVRANNSYSQNTTFDFELKNITLKEVFEEIESSSEFIFFYFDGALDVNRKVNLRLHEGDIYEILNELFHSSNNSYKVLDRQIIIYKNEPIKPVHPKLDTEVNFESTLQKVAIKGIVTDIKGNPLPGVNILEKGTTNGTVTDLDGKYSISVGSTNIVLSFSYVGFLTEEIDVSGKSTVNVALVEDILSLSEVVVVGYGSMKKSDLTGSVSTIKSEEISAYPSGGAVQALQGRAAGVDIQSVNGEPGSSFKVRVRGATSINSSSDPLFVVDGFPGGAMPPSEDIESVEVLKDASATAIYGSRGANGVFLITTKRGKKGEPQVEFNSSYSMQQEINRFDMLNAQQYISYYNEAYPTDIIDPNKTYPDTDWQDVIYRNGVIQNYQLSVAGGSDSYKYYVSGVIYDQDGVVIDSDYKRYSITSNVDIDLSDKLKIGINLFGISSNSDGSLTQERVGGSSTGVTSGAILFQPYLGIYNDDGTYTTTQSGDPFDNPYAIAIERTDETVSETLQSNMFAELQILPALTFKTTFGARMYNTRNGEYIPSCLIQGSNVGGQATITTRRVRNIISENYLTFNKEIGKHNVTLMGGYSYESGRTEYAMAKSQNYITDSFDFWYLSAGATSVTPSSSLTESELASFYGRLNYKLFDRYLFTFNTRYDGSSKFAKNKKWAFFPSGAIAWNLAEESFMQDISKISQLKLRSSYGVTGSQSISAYQSLARLRTINSTTIGSEIVNAIGQNSVANDELTWESTAQTNLGFDLGLFDQRIQIIADYYKMKTTDLLFSMPLPEYSGYSSLLKNIGAMENKGVEFTLRTDNLRGVFNWTTDINFSRNRNKILELPDGDDIFLSNGPGHMIDIGDTQILREGEPMGQFYGFVFDGIYQEGETILEGMDSGKSAGDEKFKDLNGDGSITGGDDREIIGDPNPDFTWGLNNSIEYKGIDFNVFFQGSHGNDIYSFTLMELESMTSFGNKTTRALERWTPTNTNTDVPRASSTRSLISLSRHVYDGSYIRLKNISLGYKLPDALINKLKIDYARIYISGQNILTITDYPGIDPEVNWQGASGSAANTNIGMDYGSYPNAKSYTVGVQVKF